MSGIAKHIWIDGHEDAVGVWHKGYWGQYDPDARRPKPIAPMIMRDIEPYRSVITRELIGGRAQHRAHLREHNCIEVGNEMGALKTPNVPLPPPREDIIRALESSPEAHAEAQKASERAENAV